LRRAYENAALSPSQVHYLEAHGTGTLMGDAIEIKAIERVFNFSALADSSKQRCHIGTAKTNIGHTETASGIAGLIKVALSLYHRQIPAHLHFGHPSPYIEFNKLSLQIPTILTPLPSEGSLYAGISAFGMGGTNAHVVLESAPPVSILNPDSSINNAYHILILSAKTESALRQMAINYHDFLQEHPEVDISQICATAMRRSQFNYRLAIVVNEIDTNATNTNAIGILQQSLNEYICDLPSNQIFSGKANPKKHKKYAVPTVLNIQEHIINKLNKIYPQHTLEQICFCMPSLPELDPNIQHSLRSQFIDLWLSGVKVNWGSLYANSNLQVVSLPSYPFERQSFWTQPSFQPNLSAVTSIVSDIPITNQKKTKSARDLEIDFVAPRDRMEQKLAAIWEKIFDMKPIGIHDNFFDIGGTSIIAVNLFTKIEQTFKCQLNLVVLFQYPTIAQLAEMLSQLHQQGATEQLATQSTLVPIREKGIHPPIFCVSGIHGSVLIYADLAKHLGADQPFYGLQPRGIDGGNSPLTSIEAIAAYYIQAMQTVQPKGPYFLGGFSLGSKVVWEMAQQLRQQGQKVALLALFDGTASSTSSVRVPFYQRIGLHYQRLREKGFTYISQKFPAWQAWLSGRYQHWTKKIVRRFYQRLQWQLPIYLRQSAIEESLEKAGIEALKNYVLQVYPDKVTLFRADIQASDQGVGFVPLDLDLGWKDLAKGELEIQTISGEHMSMFREPHVQILAQKLQECLHRARQIQI
jgi:thioesterase domain-containing protein/acyl carrier protein